MCCEITHFCKLFIQLLKPKDVHVIQVIATHRFCQFQNVYVTWFCGLLAGTVDIFSGSCIQYFFHLFCYNPRVKVKKERVSYSFLRPILERHEIFAVNAKKPSVSQILNQPVSVARLGRQDAVNVISSHKMCYCAVCCYVYRILFKNVSLCI